MTKINLTKLFIILLTIVSSGCISDLEFDYPATPNLPVVNALLNPDSSISVNIYKLMGVSELSSELITDASVIIYENQGDSISLYLIGEGQYVAEHFPQAGQQYSIKVDVSGYGQISAVTTIPHTNPTISATLGSTWSYYSPPQYIDQIKAYPVLITLSPIENNNYLIFRLMAKRYGHYWSNDSIDTYEPIIPPRFDMVSLFSSDTKFTGVGQDTYYVLQNEHSSFQENFTLILWVSQFVWVTGFGDQGEHLFDTDLYLDVLTCSPDFYQYFRTYIINASERVNPFAEPIEVYSNIENGLGIFAGYSMQRILLNQR
jgi:hypothetical protein